MRSGTSSGSNAGGPAFQRLSIRLSSAVSVSFWACFAWPHCPLPGVDPCGGCSGQGHAPGCWLPRSRGRAGPGSHCRSAWSSWTDVSGSISVRAGAGVRWLAWRPSWSLWWLGRIRMSGIVSGMPIRRSPGPLRRTGAVVQAFGSGRRYTQR